jgi:small subunit ribosomal protein S9
MSLKKALRSVGRRKEATARVYLLPVEETKTEAADAEKEPTLQITVNKKDFRVYFPRKTAQMIIAQPLEVTERIGRYQFDIRVNGGGNAGQAGAVRHGIARALEKAEPELRPALKASGFLTRDPRKVERKKPGRHKARKSTQFSKR